MVPALRSLLDLVEVTYAAALDPSRWVDALHLLARLFEGNGAGLHVERAGSPVTQRWVGLDPRFIEAYRERYWREDPWAPGARRLPHGAVGFGDDLVPRSDLASSAFYKELAGPYQVDDLLVAAVAHTNRELVLVTVTRGPRHRFASADARTMRDLVPHLARALEIGERTRSFPLDASAAPSALLETRLELVYGLTPAEARVAAQVGRGKAPKEAAAAFGTSWNTVRSQLRRVYAKTTTSGQPELARLVARLELSADV
ncbi:MAG: helix-turn-helix transcriptional regulator [Polyangiaceae bacterium]|nr:helix-turn-helix transcriptional regulator [Polyangiaceae bacterium]